MIDAQRDFKLQSNRILNYHTTHFAMLDRNDRKQCVTLYATLLRPRDDHPQRLYATNFLPLFMTIQLANTRSTAHPTTFRRIRDIFAQTVPFALCGLINSQTANTRALLYNYAVPRRLPLLPTTPVSTDASCDSHAPVQALRLSLLHFLRHVAPPFLHVLAGFFLRQSGQ